MVAQPISVETYHALGESGIILEKTELLYGFIYKKPRKTPFHCYLLQRLVDLLEQIELPNRFVNQHRPLTIGDSEPEADIAVLSGTIDDYRTAHPKTAELVIEICVTTHNYDRSKLRAYASGNVKECWLVLGPENQVEVYSQPNNGSFGRKTVHGCGDVLKSHAVPELAVDLEALFAQ